MELIHSLQLIFKNRPSTFLTFDKSQKSSEDEYLIDRFMYKDNAAQDLT